MAFYGSLVDPANPVWGKSPTQLAPEMKAPVLGLYGEAGPWRYRTYLTTIKTRTAELKKQGRTADETVTTITAEMQPKYPDANRLGGAIRVAYKEAP